ncbi:MAG: hypothetical protein ACXIUD_07715 [Mongoliitalea sp.]
MGYLPLFLTFGGFIMLFMMVVSSTFNNKKKRLIQLSEQALSIMHGLDQSIQIQAAGNTQAVEQAIQGFQDKKEAFLKANPEVVEKELLPAMKNLKLAKAGYNQLLAEKPYSFVGKLMGHQPFN